MENIKNAFTVNYCKVGKPTSMRKMNVTTSTYEDVIFSFWLNERCQVVFNMDFIHELLSNCILIKRTQANGRRCEYSIIFKDMRDPKKMLFEYIVHIECVFDSNEIDILMQEVDLNPRNEYIPPKRLKKTSKWVRKEKLGVKLFLIALEKNKNLKKLKEIIPKATFHRYVKHCRREGFIDGDKLIRKVMV